jgi:hypothetical protein
MAPIHISPLGKGRMIQETTEEITDTHLRWQVELESRYARRNKVRYIDYLLNELEMLNLADCDAMPMALKREVRDFFEAHEHFLGRKPLRDLCIPESMEALYDIQDNFLLGSEDEEEY